MSPTRTRQLGLSAVMFALIACSSSDPPVEGGDPDDKDRPGSTGGKDGGRKPDTGTSGGSSDAGKPGKPGTPVTLERCDPGDPAALTSEQIAALNAGGELGAARITYPYNGTVFPRGLQSPLLMWDGVEGEQEAAYLSIKSKSFQFRGCFKPANPGQLEIPQDVWDEAAGGSTGKGDPFTVSLTVLAGGKAVGPIEEQVIIAPGSMKGSLFYNSYASARARKEGASGGAILRIPAGGEAEVFLGQRVCVGCHGASADGTRLVTNEGVYAIERGSAVNPPSLRGTGSELEFPGLTPDGKFYATKGQFFNTDKGGTAGGGTFGPQLPTSSNEVSFSPSGDWVAFMDGGPGPRSGSTSPVTIPGLGGLGIPGLGGGGGNGSAISPGVSGGAGKIVVMKYGSDNQQFTDAKPFRNVSGSAQWPVFLPDDKALVFADTTTNDLMLLDIASSKVTPLAHAMGFASSDDATAGKSALPFAADGESRAAYYPTVAPVAAGGYFWVYFDTPRLYGNVDTTKIDSGLALPNGITAGGGVPIEIPGLTGLHQPSRQLWVTALEISPDGTYTTDRSSPAFFLPGQEIGANNHRAFSTLDPCLEVGGSCDSGTKCCSGFCTDGQCVSPPADRCAETEEACKSAADCCDTTNSCIGGFCSVIILI